MRIWHGIETIRQPFERCTLAVGVFDGIHIGHQELIRRGVEDARGNNRRFVIMTFDRHPLEIIAPQKAPPALTTMKQRIRLLESLDVDDLVIARFDDRFRQLSPEGFLHFVVCGVLGADSVYVGGDFHFGMEQAGDTQYLRDSAQRLNLEVHVMEPILAHGVKASSSRVRELIRAGDLRGAAAILGRPYTLVGRIVDGQKLGRALGYPTANVDNENQMAIPADGIYATWVQHRGGRSMGACSIGFRPTVAGTDRTIEVYLLEFEGNLYGAEIEIDFVERLRDELTFESFAALTQQIALDVEDTRRTLQSTTGGQTHRPPS